MGGSFGRIDSMHVMTAEEIVALLRDCAAELQQQANTKMASLGVVSREEETKGQRKVRDSAEHDWYAAGILTRLIEEIEY
jgi:BMFP domain-containing protein YqiC